MNKNDVGLIIIILIISIVLIGVYSFNPKNNNLYAFVYYENKLLLEIDLSLKEKEYEVQGENGTVYIKAGNGKIKVEEENSPYHLCSKQGYISKSYESIVCLPNKIIIKIKDKTNEIDTVIK